MATYNTRNRSKLFKSGLVNTSDVADSAISLSKVAQDVVDYVASSGGGSGLFNKNINSSIGYELTTTMSTALTLTADAVIHSIILTNIGNGAITADGDLTPSGGSAIGSFLGIPLPVNSSVEILKKPMVVKTGDVISLKASASSSAYAVIVYETTTDTAYKRTSAKATTTVSTLYTSTGYPSVVESVKVANIDTGLADHAITVKLTNSSDVVKGYLANNLIIPSGSTVELCENAKYMETGDKITIQSTFNNAISAFVSAKSIT